MSREPVNATPRKAMTSARRSRLVATQGELCAHDGCLRMWVDVDHIIPLELGGADEDFNLEGLCKEHHRAKTNADLKRISKARRLRKKEAGEVRAKRPIQSRGFSTTLRRLFNGTVVSAASRGGEQ